MCHPNPRNRCLTAYADQNRHFNHLRSCHSTWTELFWRKWAQYHGTGVFEDPSCEQCRHALHTRVPCILLQSVCRLLETPTKPNLWSWPPNQCSRRPHVIFDGEYLETRLQAGCLYPQHPRLDCHSCDSQRLAGRLQQNLVSFRTSLDGVVNQARFAAQAKTSL